MSNVRKVTIFYSMTLAMSLGLALFAAPVIGEWSTMIVMLTPLVAVLIMKLAITREGYSRSGWADLGLDRAGTKVWGLAVGVPFVVLLAAYAGVWISGVAGVQMPANIPDVLINFALNFSIALILCFGEEVGWRGYMLPKLLGLGTVPAMLWTGFLQGVWHLPFIVFTSLYHGEGNVLLIVVLFLTTMTVAGVLFGYLRIVSGSTWPAVIAHSIFNAWWTLFGAFTVASSPLAFEYLAGESGLLTLVGTMIAAVWLVRRMSPSASLRARYA